MPQILLAFDKFKSSHSAESVGGIVSQIFSTKFSILSVPLSDGGDGFVQLLAQQVSAPLFNIEVRDPLMRTVTASIAIVPFNSVPIAVRKRLKLESGPLALVDMASASGIALLDHEDRNTFHATSFGTGELLRYASQQKPVAILLGIGGSATNDLGLGALHALGLSFHTEVACPILPTPEIFSEFKRFDLSKKVELPSIFIACDVTNPLLGVDGCTKTFGAQKGLHPQDIDRAEKELAKMADALCRVHDKEIGIADLPGMGAAGGIGFGLNIAYDAKLIPGFETVSEWFDLENSIAQSDIVVTGEGRFDMSSLQGKGPAEILRKAAAHHKRLGLFCGSVEQRAVDLLKRELGTEIIVETLIGDGVIFDPTLHTSEVLLKEAAERLKEKLRSCC